MTEQETLNESLGQKLARIRHEKSFSQEDVARELHVDVRFIDAIEQGRFEELPGPTFVQGYLRAYARYLDLNPDEILGNYQGHHNQPDFSRKSDASIQWGSFILIVLLLLVVSGTAWIYQSMKIAEKLEQAEPQGAKAKTLEAYISLGYAYLESGEMDKAKASFDSAIKINKYSSAANAALARYFAAIKQAEEAGKYFNDALLFDPEDTQTRLLYGVFLYEFKRFQQAHQELEQAALDEQFEQKSQVFEHLGLVELALGFETKAESYFKRAVELDAEQSRSLIELAKIQFNRRAYRDARRFFNRYAETSEHTAESLWLGIRLRQVFDDYRGERELIQLLETYFPNSPEYRKYKELKSDD